MTRSKSNLKKNLHVIYFVDNAQTRALHLPVKRVWSIAIACLLLVLWTVASCYIVAKLLYRQSHLQTLLSEAKTVIFDYESKYEDIFQTAYPKSDKPIVASDEIQEFSDYISSGGKSQDAKGTGKETGKDSANSDNVAEASNPAGGKAVPNDDAKLASADATAKMPGDRAAENTIELGDKSFHFVSSGLEVRFLLKNHAKEEKASGYIWAVAKLTTPDSKDSVQLGSPEGVLMADGNPKLLKGVASKFSIWRFKNKSFKFVIPAAMTSARFESVTIKIMDQDLKIQSHVVPVPKEFQKVQATNATGPSGQNAIDQADSPKEDSPVDGGPLEDSPMEDSPANSNQGMTEDESATPPSSANQGQDKGKALQ